MPLPGYSVTAAGAPDALTPPDGQSCQIGLHELTKGQCGVVTDLELADGDDNRLRSLGICPGRRIWLVRKGDPMVVRVMNSRIGLARALARQVTVEVCAPPCTIATDLTPAEQHREADR